MDLLSATEGLTNPRKSCGHLSSRGRRWIKMPGYVALCLELVILLMLPISARTKTVSIYWNSSSPTFLTNDSVMEFWEGDSITLVCPYYPGGDPNTWEYYIVYMVSKHMYDLCVINDTDTIQNMITCDKPERQEKYTHLLLAFSPQGVDFHQGNDYYFISTSGGRRSNLDNMYHGACKNNNMRLKIRFHGRRPPPDNTGGSGGDDGGGSSGNNQPDPPLTRPTQPPTERSTVTTTTTEAAETQRPAVTTAAPTLSPTRRPKPLGGGTGVSGDNNEPIPGSDGFPNDETVIHAGGGNRGGRDSNINSGVIEDSSARDSGRSSHGTFGSLSCLSRLLAIATGLVISYVLAHADIVSGR